jgi:hypothetical protein
MKNKIKLIITILVALVLVGVVIIWGLSECDAGGSEYEFAFEDEIETTEGTYETMISYPVKNISFNVSGKLSAGSIKLEVYDENENLLCTFDGEAGNEYDFSKVLNSKSSYYTLKYSYSEDAKGLLECELDAVTTKWNHAFRKKL